MNLTPFPPGGPDARSRYPELLAGELLGAEVLRGGRRAAVGEIVDLVIDAGPRVRRAVLALGGLLGATLVSVPFEALAIDPATAEHALCCETARSWPRAAPGGEPGHRHGRGRGRGHGHGHGHGHGRGRNADAFAGAGGVGLRALLAMDVVDDGGVSVGDVRDLVLRPDGAVSHLVVSLVGEPDADECLVTVPRERLHVLRDREGERVRFDGDAGALGAMPARDARARRSVRAQPSFA